MTKTITQDINDPINPELEALVKAGKVIKAVLPNLRLRRYFFI